MWKRLHSDIDKTFQLADAARRPITMPKMVLPYIQMRFSHIPQPAVQPHMSWNWRSAAAGWWQGSTHAASQAPECFCASSTSVLLHTPDFVKGMQDGLTSFHAHDRTTLSAVHLRPGYRILAGRPSESRLVLLLALCMHSRLPQQRWEVSPCPQNLCWQPMWHGSSGGSKSATTALCPWLGTFLVHITSAGTVCGAAAVAAAQKRHSGSMSMAQWNLDSRLLLKIFSMGTCHTSSTSASCRCASAAL